MKARLGSAVRWTVCLLLLGLAHCKKEQAPVPPVVAKQAPVALSATAQQRLAAADRADGKADKVVDKCIMCGLSMKGSEKHRASVEGYQVHLCSAHCKEAFSADPNKALLDLELPQGKAATKKAP
jgi:hypothetical protein